MAICVIDMRRFSKYQERSEIIRANENLLEGYRTPPEVTKSRLWSTLDNSGRTTGYTAILADN